MSTKRRPLPKRRNPEAMALQSPIFRNRAIKSRKLYSRKNRKEEGA